MYLCEWHLEDHHRTESVEKNLESAEKCLPKHRIQKNCLKARRKICVQPINAQCFVVDQMVGLADTVSVTRPMCPCAQKEKLTLKAALYGTPMGRFAKIASSLLAIPDLKARLCEISWMDRNRFWLAVAPIIYAVSRNGQDSMGVFRSAKAHAICNDTTKSTTYLVSGSGPHSLVT